MKQPLIIAMLAVLAIGSFWLMRDLEKDLSTDTSATPTREIAIAYDVNGRYYNAENFLQYKLTSDTVSEFSNQAGTRFNNPDVQVLTADQRLAWQGQAANAHLSSDKNQLTLAGGVTLIESPTTPKPMYARSETMVYNAQTRRVSSDTTVTVTGDNMQQTAAGFWFDVPTRTVTFQGNVRANYQPEIAKPTHQ